MVSPLRHAMIAVLLSSVHITSNGRQHLFASKEEKHAVFGVATRVADASTNMYGEICPHCDRWQSIGPPPDGILEMPPPPLPSFLSSWVVGANRTNRCSLCHLLADDRTSTYVDPLRPTLKVDRSWVSTVILVSVTVGVVICAMLACKGKPWKILPVAESLLTHKEVPSAELAPPKNVVATSPPDATTLRRSEAEGHVYAEPDLAYENSGFLEGAEGYGPSPPRSLYGALRNLLPNGYDHLEGPRPHKGRPLPPLPPLTRPL